MLSWLCCLSGRAFEPRGAVLGRSPSSTSTALSTKTEHPHADATPPLLRLPVAIRNQIYQRVGVISQNGQPFTFDLHGGGIGKPPHRRGDVPALRIACRFHGLLLSCRAIYAEAAGLLYSRNCLVIYYLRPGTLRPLFNLTAAAVAPLASLKIVLHESSCHQPFDYYPRWLCCDYPAPSTNSASRYFMALCDPYHVHAGPPVASGAGGKAGPSGTLVDEFRAVIDHLASRITPGRLHLGLVCDINDQHNQAMDLATAILDPLRGLPLLKSCQIRLCQKPNDDLREAAQMASLRACGIPQPSVKATSATPGFLTLPREIRLRILEMTDLVTPSKEVWWSRHVRKYMWGSYKRVGRSFDERQLARRDIYMECWEVLSAYQHGEVGQNQMGCFCRRQHSALRPSALAGFHQGPGFSSFVVRSARKPDLFSSPPTASSSTT